MNRRSLLALLLVGALSAVPAVAADHDPSEAAVRTPDRPAQRPDAVQTSTLDQRAIFGILCGGLSVTEASLSTHLWQVAGALAESSWTPPRVTVRVVVSEPSIR